MENKNLEVFSKAPVPQAVLKNVLPAMVAMLMVLIYNLADTFFIGQTRNDILILASFPGNAGVSNFYGSRDGVRRGRHICDFPCHG